MLGGLRGLDGGLLHKALRDPSGAARDRQALVRLLSQTLGLVGGEAQRYAPQELQQVEVGAWSSQVRQSYVSARLLGRAGQPSAAKGWGWVLFLFCNGHVVPKRSIGAVEEALRRGF